MNATYRKALLVNLSCRDHITTEASAILEAPADAEIGMMAEDVYEFANDIRAEVEAKLERGEP